MLNFERRHQPCLTTSNITSNHISSASLITSTSLLVCLYISKLQSIFHYLSLIFIITISYSPCTALPQLSFRSLSISLVPLPLPCLLSLTILLRLASLYLEPTPHIILNYIIYFFYLSLISPYTFYSSSITSPPFPNHAASLNFTILKSGRHLTSS